MSWFRSPPHRALLSIVALYAMMVAVVLGLRGMGIHLSLPVRLAIAIPIALAACAFIYQYWRALDEVAREAHKWSWYWGGSFGMALAFLLLMIKPLGIAAYLQANSVPEHLLFHGALVVIASQLVGATLAWLFWWARRR